MASTRNINTPGNYCLENRTYKEAEKYTTYKYSQYGEAYNSQLPGLGLLPGQMSWNQLSNNPADIESFLFGINSTDLTKSQPTPCFTPSLKYLTSANIYTAPPVYLPEKLIVSTKNRPFPIP
jgi:hypothetical protein